MQVLWRGGASVRGLPDLDTFKKLDKLGLVRQGWLLTCAACQILGPYVCARILPYLPILKGTSLPTCLICSSLVHCLLNNATLTEQVYPTAERLLQMRTCDPSASS